MPKIRFDRCVGYGTFVLAFVAMFLLLFAAHAWMLTKLPGAFVLRRVYTLYGYGATWKGTLSTEIDLYMPCVILSLTSGFVLRSEYKLGKRLLLTVVLGAVTTGAFFLLGTLWARIGWSPLPVWPKNPKLHGGTIVPQEVFVTYCAVCLFTAASAQRRKDEKKAPEDVKR